MEGFSFCCAQWDSNRAAVNDSPVGCQSRDRASPAGEVESRGARQSENPVTKWQGFCFVLFTFKFSVFSFQLTGQDFPNEY